MSKAKDHAGKRFGRLIAVRPIQTENGRRWECKCECGQTCYVRAPYLLSGHTQSCGCLWKDTFVGSTRTHGQTDTSLYRVWTLMLQRCHNPNNPAFAKYGGRGIIVCQKWRDSFEEFAADVGVRPGLQYSIDRIDNDGNYEPSNVRWATRHVQANNNRKNHNLTYNGVTQSISLWSKATGLSQRTILTRITQLGWTAERALTTRPRKQRNNYAIVS